MANAQVVTSCDKLPTASYYRYDLYLQSLARFAEVPTVLGWEQPWSGLMTKPFWLRDWLRAGNNTSDRLIVTDAFDIIFAQHPHGIGDRCAELFGDAVVTNGEKGCWPRGDLVDCFPDDGSPWRFLNSGFMCGPADKILALLEAMDCDSIGLDRTEPDGRKVEPNDQGEYQALFAKQPVKMVVDTQCVLAQTLSACELDEFDLSGEQIVNKFTGTTPGVFHFNGGSKSNGIMDAFLAKLGY